MDILIPKSSNYLEISKSALKNNIDYIKEHFLPSDCRLSCVVKGNAYGHGIEQIIKIHQEINNIDHFCVYSAFEALSVKKSLIKNATILIMGDTDPSAVPWVIENNIEFFIFDTENLIKTINIAKLQRKKAKIHLEVETGMNRTGFLVKNFKKCIDIIKDNLDCIEVIGLCTHFAGAESIANHVRVKKQLKKFDKFKDIAKSSGLDYQICHTACSAAAIRFKKSRMNLLRIGILQYGFWPNQETYITHFLKNNLKSNPLMRVISWKSRVMSIKLVGAGEFVGYGTSHFTNEQKLIAVIPVGYSNGYSRSLSNQARVLIRGELALVTGIVNMNGISVDVTHIKDVEAGDEVVLIGHQGEKEVKVSSFSEITDQLNYEVLARLPMDIPREIVI